jgi:division protein CdvB (Snf7/Vps24/ESCRT-III family)
VQRHDTNTTKVLSNELAEVRKVSRTLGQAKMAFEQVSMRLSTIHDMGDVMVALGPAITSIKSIKPGLGKFVPGADSEINTMQTLLNGIMMESRDQYRLWQRHRSDNDGSFSSRRAEDERQVPIDPIWQLQDLRH